MIQVQLAGDWENFIEDKLRAGQFASAEQVVSEGLRLMRENEHRLVRSREEIRMKLKEGWESLREGRSVDGETALEELRKELAEVER